MLGLNLGLVPVMCDVELNPELSVDELRELLGRFMAANVAEIGFVREVAHTMGDWENSIVQLNLSSGWTDSPNEGVLNLVGVIPVIVADDGSTLDLIVCRFKPGNKLWQLCFWWDVNQRHIEAPRNRENHQQVVDTFARMDHQLFGH